MLFLACLAGALAMENHTYYLDVYNDGTRFSKALCLDENNWWAVCGDGERIALTIYEDGTATSNGQKIVWDNGHMQTGDNYTGSPGVFAATYDSRDDMVLSYNGSTSFWLCQSGYEFIGWTLGANDDDEAPARVCNLPGDDDEDDSSGFLGQIYLEWEDDIVCSGESCPVANVSSYWSTPHTTLAWPFGASATTNVAGSGSTNLVSSTSDGSSAGASASPAVTASGPSSSASSAGSSASGTGSSAGSSASSAGSGASSIGSSVSSAGSSAPSAASSSASNKAAIVNVNAWLLALIL